MKNIDLRLLLRLMSVPAIILLFISSYFLYNSYKQYTNAQVLSTDIQIQKELSKVLIAVQDEKIKSYIYFYSNNEVPLAKSDLKRTRTNLDSIVVNLNDFIVSEHIEIDANFKTIISNLKNLSKVRVDIDNFTKNNFEQRYDNISNLIVKYSKNSTLTSSLHSTQHLVQLKVFMQELVNKTFAEKSIISFYLLQDSVIPEDRYDMIKNTIETNFYQFNLKNSIWDPEILKLINSTTFKISLVDLYEARKSISTTLLKYFDTDEFYGYTIDVLDWTNITSKYIKNLNQIIHQLDLKLLHEVQNIQDEQKALLASAFATFLITFFILIVNIFLIYWTARRISKLSKIVESVSDIGVVNHNKIDILTTYGQEKALDTIPSPEASSNR